jgi:UTP--glucose-1-phosphate uridylyltransferase
MLGDHVFRTDTDTPCAAQVVAAYEAAGGHVVGLAKTAPAEVASFGTATGTWVRQDDLLAVTEFAEKPSLDYAEANLRVEGVEDAFLTFFGLYALGPAVFEHLEHLCDHNVRKGGEFQLNDALSLLRRHEPCFGCLVRGRRFDTGRPGAYLKTLAAFASAEAAGPPRSPAPTPGSTKADR